MKKLIVLLFASVLAFSSFSIEAERLGGGKPMGKQSTNVTNKNVAPVTKDVTPTKSATTPAAPTPVATPVSKPWGAMLGGVAAGLGLAWLANSLGMSAAFGNILLALLIGFIILAFIGWFISRRKVEPTLAEK